MTLRQARGFTLLELMIGLALLGLIMTLIFAGLQLTIRGWDETEATSERVNRVRQARALLLRELAAVYPYRWKNNSEMNLAFVGATNGLKFVSSTPPRAGRGGLNLVELLLGKNDKGMQLLMRRRIPATELRDFDDMERAESVVLLDDMESVAFEYFGADTPSAKPYWRDKWEDRQRLPRLVRVNLRTKGAPPWPAIIVELRVSERAGCKGWDPDNGQCHGDEPK